MKRNDATPWLWRRADGLHFPSLELAQKWIPGEAEPSREELLPPRIDRLGVRATLLRLGMPAGYGRGSWERPHRSTPLKAKAAMFASLD
jgi:hypothetical protein